MHVRIRSGLISCIQIICKKHGKILFEFISAVLPSDVRGNVHESVSAQTPLVYMMLNDSSNEIRALAASSLASLIEEFPELEAMESLDITGRVLNSKFHELAGILDNLHEIINFMLRSKLAPEVLIAALKTTAALISKTRYQAFSPSHLLKITESIMIHLGAFIPEIRFGVVKCLIAAFKERIEKIKHILTYDFVYHVLGSQDFIEERLELFERLIKNYPEEMDSFKDWIQGKLSTIMLSDNLSLQKKAYEITDEYIRVKPNCCAIDTAIKTALILIKRQPIDTLAPCLSTLAVIPDIAVLKPQQVQDLIYFLENFDFSGNSPSLLKSIVMKLFGTLAKAQLVPEDFFDRGISIISAHRDTSNLSVAINASLALSYFCLNPISLSRIETIVDIIKDSSENRREKVVSNAIVSISNLFEMFNYHQIQQYFDELFGICVRGLSHKTAKVGWDACKAFFAFFGNESMPHYEVADRLIPNLIQAIKMQNNFKTKINSCQILRKFSSQLLAYSSEILQSLVWCLEIDGRSKHSDSKTLQYQFEFKQESILCIAHIMDINTELSEELIEFLSENCLNVYHWLRAFAIDYVHENSSKDPSELESDENIEIIRKCCRKLIMWVQSEARVGVSFGLLEKLEGLSRIDERKIRKYMGCEAESDLIISLKNILIDNFSSL
mmetsp:Transcript_29909/g.29622  ORF Transcript_29909/g.29622 Transcript_29909/m.29622 type:complete len:669 (+) Transcript_29909:358-2364(+)